MTAIDLEASLRHLADRRGAAVPDVFVRATAPTAGLLAPLSPVTSTDPVDAVRAHAEATGVANLRLAAAMAMSVLLRNLVWMNVAMNLELGRVVDVAPEDVLVGVGPDGRWEPRGAITAGALVTGSVPGSRSAVRDGRAVIEADEAARWAIVHHVLDRVRAALEQRWSELGRLPGRLVDANVAATWLTVLRVELGAAGRERIPAEIRRHWAARPDLWHAVRELSVPTPHGGRRPFFVRTACCLEFQQQDSGQALCGGCPMVPDDVLVTRRAALDAGASLPPLTR